MMKERFRRKMLPVLCMTGVSSMLFALCTAAEEMTEAVHVAAAMKAGITLVHGVQMKNIVDKLEM